MTASQSAYLRALPVPFTAYSCRVTCYPSSHPLTHHTYVIITCSLLRIFMQRHLLSIIPSPDLPYFHIHYFIPSTHIHATLLATRRPLMVYLGLKLCKQKQSASRQQRGDACPQSRGKIDGNGKIALTINKEEEYTW